VTGQRCTSHVLFKHVIDRLKDPAAKPTATRKFDDDDDEIETKRTVAREGQAWKTTDRSSNEKKRRKLENMIGKLGLRKLEKTAKRSQSRRNRYLEDNNSRCARSCRRKELFALLLRAFLLRAFLFCTCFFYCVLFYSVRAFFTACSFILYVLAVDHYCSYSIYSI
jgi:hypothetical protein